MERRYVGGIDIRGYFWGVSGECFFLFLGLCLFIAWMSIRVLIFRWAMMFSCVRRRIIFR